MTEIPLTTRVPRELGRALEQYMKTEHLERSAAVRRLLYAALQQWREEYALRLLQERKTTMSKAAEIAGLDLWSFVALVKEKRVQWVDDQVVDEELADL